MTEVQETREFTFRLERFEILDYFYRAPSRTLPKNARIRFSLNSQLRPNPKSKSLAITILAQVIWNKRISPEPLGSIRTMSSFKFVDSKDISIEKNEMNVPVDFVKAIIGLAYSTTRGALAAKTAGTILEKYPLPLIDPKVITPKAILKKKT